MARRRNGSDRRCVSEVPPRLDLNSYAILMLVSGSVYEPAPTLSLTFHPYSPPSEIEPILHDPTSTLLPPQTLTATKFNSYTGHNGTFSFWRFIIEIPLQSQEMTARYKLNGGAEMSFVLPYIGQNFHWAAHSCNGEPPEFLPP